MLRVIYPSYIYASVTRPCFYCSPPPRASRAPQLLMIKSGFRLLLFILLAVFYVVVILHRRRTPDRRAMDGMASPVPPIDRLLIYFFFFIPFRPVVRLGGLKMAKYWGKKNLPLISQRGGVWFDGGSDFEFSENPFFPQTYTNVVLLF